MLKIDVESFDLGRTLGCGQAFRWRRSGGGWFGVSGNTPIYASQDGKTLLLDCRESDEDYWKRYFALDADYTGLETLLASDPMTAPCLECSAGIRVLRQQPFETLISFIISANNNVGRISGIIERLCVLCGERGEYGGREYFGFPQPESVAALEESALVGICAGYRAPYIIKSAQKVADGYDIEALRKLDFDSARRELLTFSGVGPKVAECVMLFSLGFDAAFPVDVWIKRVVEVLEPEGGADAAGRCAHRFGSMAGAAQQYLFNYARIKGLGKGKTKTQ